MANLFLHRCGKLIIPHPASAARWMRRHPDQEFTGKYKYFSNGTHAKSYLSVKEAKKRHA